MKKVFSFKAQKPPLRSRRESGPGGSARETSRDFSKTEKYQKSERGGSIFCNFRLVQIVLLHRRKKFRLLEFFHTLLAAKKIFSMPLFLKQFVDTHAN